MDEINNSNQLNTHKREETSPENQTSSITGAHQLDINPDLTGLSLDDLIIQFQEVDRQYHLLKGKILLEARGRFLSDKEFGKWISHSSWVGSQQSRNRLMHLADFFRDDHDMSGITISAAYEISAPVNRDKAQEVYEKVHGKNLAVKEVKALFTETAGKVVKKDKQNEGAEKKFKDNPSIERGSSDQVDLMAIKIADEIMAKKSDLFKIDVLKRAIQYIENKSLQG